MKPYKDERIVCTFFSYEGEPPVSELELLHVFLRRVVALNKDIKTIVITNKQNAIHLNGMCDVIHTIEVSKETLLFDRCRGNLEVLRTYDNAAQIIFSDYDIVYNALPSVTNCESLLLTVRDLPRQPINGGLLVFSRPTEKSRAFYENVFSMYTRVPPALRSWWGDQISLYEAVRHHDSELRRLQNFVVNGLLIVPASVELFNWTPFDLDTSPATLRDNFFLTETAANSYSKRRVIHFKGPRKHLMMQYARTQFGKNLSALPKFKALESYEEATQKIEELKLCIKTIRSNHFSIWELVDNLFGCLVATDKCLLKSKDIPQLTRSLLDDLMEVHIDPRFQLLR